MGLRIQTNVPALTAQKNLAISTDSVTSSMEKMSSGYRINKAADDAAGLAISEKLKADVRGMNMAKRNANDGISLVQVAEGGLNEIQNILVRLRELSVQGASDTISDTERGFLNEEYSQMKLEITRITNSTEYNGTRLLAGEQDNLPDDLKNRANEFPLEIQIGKDYFTEVDAIDSENTVNTLRLDFQKINASVSEDGLDLGEDPEDGANVAGKVASQQSLVKLDSAISKVSGYRATLGAIQNRLGSAVANLSTQTENASAANSRIRDTDFAEESSKLAQSQIVKQAGTAVLAQANQSTQGALQLLG
jgi:flagellin